LPLTRARGDELALDQRRFGTPVIRLDAPPA
jgi:hypothetical protein